jgi:ribonuclease R
LALRRYVHFTSPIRRYADLLVHRALIAGIASAGRDSGAGGLPAGSAGGGSFAELGAHISAMERRAAAAERAALERYRAILLAGSRGSIFAARISAVAEFGLFVALADGGAQGLLPISSLPGDFYDHDPRRQRLLGRRSRRVFRLGDVLSVRLVETDPVGGRILFHLEEPRMSLPGGPTPIPARRRGRRR